MYEVIVADDVLSAQDNGMSESPGIFTGWLGPVLFHVQPHPPDASGDLSGIIAAAAAAVERFGLVSAAGLELAGEWMTAERSVADAIGPRLFRDGVVLGAFGKDEITPAQGATILRVLLGELHGRQVGARVSCAPAGIRMDDLPEVPASSPTHDEPEPTVDDPPKRWFVERGVRAVTTTGVPYVDLDWLLPDGTWSRDEQLAVSWDNTRESMMEMGALVTRLREEAESAPDPAHTEIMGVLVTPGRGNPEFSRPPASIRDHGHVWIPPGGAV